MESLLLNGDKNDCTTVPLLNYNMDAKHLVTGQVASNPESSDEPAEVRTFNTIDVSPVDKRHWDKLYQV